MRRGVSAHASRGVTVNVEVGHEKLSRRISLRLDQISNRVMRFQSDSSRP